MVDIHWEVLLDTRRHASGTYPPNYPPSIPQPNEGGSVGLLSRLLPQGITQLKDRWMEYKKPKKLRRYASLFLSTTAEYVALAIGNQISIFRKGNGYEEPTGTFTSKRSGTFVFGTWSEAHDVLGVVDDTDTIYFIKANGELISMITRNNLTVSLPLLCLILPDESPEYQSCLCAFTALSSDGLLHDIEISQDPSASVFSARASGSGAMLKQHFPRDVLCIDYHRRHKLFAIVGSAGGACMLNTSKSQGICVLSIWKKSGSSDLELMASTEFECAYSGSSADQIVSPRVLISPQCNYVVTLDDQGQLNILKFNKEQQSLLKFYSGKSLSQKTETDLSSVDMELLNDIVECSWWSDEILAVARKQAPLTLFNVCTGAKLSESDVTCSNPLLQRVDELSGFLVILDCTMPYETEQSSLYLVEQIANIKVLWNLVSVSEKSVSEMFDILIRNRRYDDAIVFAGRHGLDKDEVLKSQWLASEQGVNEINSLLSAIKDYSFVIFESINRVGPTEDAMKALIAYGLRLTDLYRFSESDDGVGSQIWGFRVARLKLLQYRDRLETYLGINMGRYSSLEYKRFRDLPLNLTATILAESGKVGALNLFFKRHPHALVPFMLEILAAIPETVPVQTYAQLLPGKTAPTNITLRDEDWVECDMMVSFIRKLPEDQSSVILSGTEPIVKRCRGFHWPSINDLSVWYKSRARDIDALSGQIENCMCLIDLACRKGIIELEDFLEDISYLYQLIYSDDDIVSKTDISLSLCTWEQLTDYDKFKLMLMGVEDKNLVETLQKKAIPFMQKRTRCMPSESQVRTMHGTSSMDVMADSFIVRWMKEISAENKLETCSIIIDGSKEMEIACFFRDEVELVECGLQCIYLCPATDRWTTMASILSKLPQLRGMEDEGLCARLKLAEGHIEAGRLLAVYQVPKPISYFLEAHNDEKGVKQILRLILSKFVRRQLGRSDNDWMNMWHDLLSLHEKAFPFLDLEYVLIEFCRGLLKAGKISLARNYLKGTGSVGLAADKAETLVIQAAREYFFSASSLDCQEVWKAKECLSILPSSRNARAEADIIDAVTIKLPNLGVNILPLQFRQMKDPMEIVNLAITSQVGAYLNVDDIIEVAKLLGLSSQDEISSVQEAIAREAAVAGDLQLAFDLCLILAKKGHGSVWDLCAALARGPALENMDVKSRKHLLGFALSHCDEESIGELLQAWKDLDMLEQCQTLEMRNGKMHLRTSVDSYPFYDDQVESCSGNIDSFGGEESQFHIKSMLSQVAKNLPSENCYSLLENGKIVSFAFVHLPWLLQVCNEVETNDKNQTSSSIFSKPYGSTRTQVILTILSWLARSGFAPKDDLIVSLAKSIMESPVTEEEDIIGCSFLLNLVDAFQGVDVVEELVKMRENYHEINSAMNVGMIYGLLHNRGFKCVDPNQRRVLLLKEFQQRQQSVPCDERDDFDKAQSTFWREWKGKLEEQKRVAEQSRILEQIIPGVETARFLSGDMEYIESCVFSLIESVKLEKNQILKDVSRLAETYGLDITKVLLHYMGCILVSAHWTVDDIAADVSEFKEVLFASAAEAIKVISLTAYPGINGHDKLRLACIYGLLSQCYFRLREQKEPTGIYEDLSPVIAARLAHFCRIVGQECFRVSFIDRLNFKNIAGLQHLNWDNFNSEVCSYIDENNVEALADMVYNLVGFYEDSVPQGILSWQDVYKCFVSSLLTCLETRSKTEVNFLNAENLHSFIVEIEQTYDIIRKYMKLIDFPVLSGLMKRFFTLILPIGNRTSSTSSGSMWQNCLIMLLGIWLKILNELQEVKVDDNSNEIFCSECLITCVKFFLNLIMEGKVTTCEAWGTVVGFINFGLTGGIEDGVFNFCKSMLFSGCKFSPVADAFASSLENTSIKDLSRLYIDILETTFSDLANGSNKHNLQCLLSSLSKLEGDLDTLNSVRHTVWRRMVEVSENLEFSSQIRVYVLELMQHVAATSQNMSGFSSEPRSSILIHPWEGWESVQLSFTQKNDKMIDGGILNVPDTSSSNRFTGNLVALKSSQILSRISPSLEISPEDVSTIESAVACFRRVSEFATSASNIDELINMLQEWEVLFLTGNNIIDPHKLSDDDGGDGNNWNNDGWGDEGWEEFVEEPDKKKEINNKSGALCIHPLHGCWMEIFKRLVELSQYKTLLKSISKHSHRTKQLLLDEDNARFLNQMLLEIDSFLALKIMLLFPFEQVQFQCLDAVENKLKHQGMSDEAGKDHELLILFLSSGIVGTIFTRSSSYGTFFSYLCHMVGYFSRVWQEAKLRRLKHGTNIDVDDDNDKISRVFAGLIFPCFVAELVLGGEKVLAGFIVMKFMHTNPSLSLLNIADDSLRMYFQKELHSHQQQQEEEDESQGFEEHVFNSISNLRGRFRYQMQSALDCCSS